MKRCKRCNLRKPDACFVRIEFKHTRRSNMRPERPAIPWRKEVPLKYCASCTVAKSNGSTAEHIAAVTQAEPIKPTPKDQELIETARRERQSRLIRAGERTYTRTPAGYPYRKRRSVHL